MGCLSDRPGHCQHSPSPPALPPATHLVHVDVEEVLLVVHRLDEPLQLANGPAVHHQHVGDAHGFAGGQLLQPALIPLDHGADFPWEGTRGEGSQSVIHWHWAHRCPATPGRSERGRGSQGAERCRKNPVMPQGTRGRTCWEVGVPPLVPQNRKCSRAQLRALQPLLAGTSSPA